MIRLVRWLRGVPRARTSTLGVTTQDMATSGAERDESGVVGWRKVAAAVDSMRRLSMPMLLTVVSSQMAPLWIDLSTGRYYWELQLTELPESPGDVTVYSQPIEAGNPPYPWVAWRPMDPLLWEIGRRAFRDHRADWMRTGDRYALQRWPNLTEISHTPEEIRMIATLANGFLTAQELGLLAGADEATAQRVLDMLSLMGAIKTATGPVAPPTIVAGDDAPGPDPKDRAQGSGLFARLRDRFEGRQS